MTATRGEGPTVDEIRGWPACVSVPRACTVTGISDTHGYELIKRREFPFRVIRMGHRYAVITQSILDVVTGGDREPA